MSRWYRAYEGTVTDAKLAEAALVVGCSRSVVIATWHAILENAAALNDGGRIDIPSRRIAAILCEPFEIIETVFAAFETVDLIKDSQVSAWKKRQYESDNSTERSRKHRASSRNANATLPQQPETPPETKAETETKKNTSQPTEPREDFDRLEAALRKAAGAQSNPSPKLFDLSPILKLIDSGVSLERVILPKLRGLAAAGKTFRSWQYPAQIITDELAEQGKTLVPPIEDDEKWKTRLGHGRIRKVWASQWGPIPGQPGCRVPAHLLERGDGEGWQDWKPEAAA